MNPFIPWDVAPCTFPHPTKAVLHKAVTSVLHVPWGAHCYQVVCSDLNSGPNGCGNWWLCGLAQHFHQCFHSGFCSFWMMNINHCCFLWNKLAISVHFTFDHTTKPSITFADMVTIHPFQSCSYDLSCTLVGSFSGGSTPQIHSKHRGNEVTPKACSFKSRLTHTGEEIIERFAVLQFISVWMHRKCIFHQVSRAAAISTLTVS